MGSESASASHDNHDSDDDDESEEAGGGSRLLGFMFGNVDNSGKLEVDYPSKEAKENLNAVADKIGSFLTAINLSEKSPSTPATLEDYDEKAEDAVDYEDIEEQYEGPEIEANTEEDHLVQKSDFSSIDVSTTVLKSSVFDDENYDEDEDENEDRIPEAVDNKCEAEAEAETRTLTGLILDTAVGDKTELVQIISVDQKIGASGYHITQTFMSSVFVAFSCYPFFALNIIIFNAIGPISMFGSQAFDVNSCNE
ncbi:hypothetical protein RND81_05G127300 [Saponaria officinalis]|uniref:TAFII-230 TBP-binding domain-containing protein n=1 Tax=Saponaria officinalis TaxID=3572 RepID=A0AAW1KXR2_SAPOF